MFCSNCGTQTKPELNYCNRCGARVSGAAEAETRKSMVENLSGAVGYVGGFGLVGFIFVAIVLLKNGVTEKALILISFFYLAALFGVCYLILEQVKSLSDTPFKKKRRLENDFQEIPYALGAPDTAQLGETVAEPAAAASSVTENTTKTLDEVLLKRR